MGVKPTGAVRAPELPVVLVHGALRGRLGLLPTAWNLRRHGIVARPFGYRTRRASLRDHGHSLSLFLDRWLGDARPPVVGFLTHSMGALVVRAYLEQAEGKHAPCQRIVMLSPPNRGSELARRNVNNPAFRWLYGQAARELQPERVAAMPGLPDSADVLVLGGGRGDPRGYNAKLTGDDDGVVAVAEMGLPNHAPRVVGGLHSTLQWRPAVIRDAAAFLKGEAR